MSKIFEQEMDSDSIKEKTEVARHIHDVGRLLTATELRSADRYWHVRQSGDKHGLIYPIQYTPLVVGIVRNFMLVYEY